MSSLNKSNPIQYIRPVRYCTSYFSGTCIHRYDTVLWYFTLFTLIWINIMRSTSICNQTATFSKRFCCVVLDVKHLSLIYNVIHSVLDTQCVPLPTTQRKGCGPGPQSACEGRGCCWDNSIPGVKWCFRSQGKTPNCMSVKWICMSFPFFCTVYKCIANNNEA